MATFSPTLLIEAGCRIFEAVGADAPNARRVAEALVDANLAGHDSHGVIRIPQYVDAVRLGEVLPNARPSVLRDGGASALVDGGWGFGQVTALYATDLAIARARVHGVAAVGGVRCNHIGRVGEYGERAARWGVVGFVVAGGFGGRAARAAPFGGREGFLGTNPLSFGIPTADDDPLLVDFATTAVAAGKIQVARAKGTPLPPDSILDREGNPTTSAEDYYAGGVMLPFGAHKGFALAMVVEMLGRAFTGSDTFAEAERGGEVYGRSGMLVLGLKADLFRAAEDFTRDVSATRARVRAISPAAGFTEVLAPGDPEVRARRTNGQRGISVEDATVNAIAQVARELGVTVDLTATGS